MATPNQLSSTAATNTESLDRTTCQMPGPSQGSNEIQLRYKLASTTFKTLCTIAKSPTRLSILTTACSATEFRSFPIKQAEKAFLREVNHHSAIPYPIKENVTLPWHKAFLVIQLDLLRTNWPTKLSAAARKDLHLELGRIRKLMDRVLRCLVDILGEKQDGKGVNTALDVLRSVKAGVWEGSEKQLLQVDGIGAVKMDRLVVAGIKNIQQLSQLECYHIERLLSRNPPFGRTILHELAGFPKLTLDFEILGQYQPPTSPVSAAAKKDGSLMTEAASSSPASTWIVRVVLGYTNGQIPSWKKLNPWLTLVVEGYNGRLVWFWRGSIKRLVGGKEMVIGLSASKGEMLNVVFACEEIVGTIMHKTVQV